MDIHTIREMEKTQNSAVPKDNTMSWDTPEAHSFVLFCRMENPATKTDRKKTKTETGVLVALWDNLLFCK